MSERTPDATFPDGEPGGTGIPPGGAPAPTHPPMPGYGPPAAPPPQPGYGEAPAWGPPPQPGYGAAPEWGGPAPWGAAPTAPPATWQPPSKPGIVPLRPIALGEIFDGAFQAIRTNPRTMIGIPALVISIVTLLSVAPLAASMANVTSVLEPGSSDRDLLSAVGGFYLTLLTSSLLKYLTMSVVTGMLVVAVSGAVLGERLGPGQVWARVGRRIWAVLGLSLLVTFAVLLLLVVGALPGVLLALAGMPVPGMLLSVAGFIGMSVLVVLLNVRWTVAAPALLLEELGVFAALRRSWRLVHGSSWRILGITFLTQIVVAIGTSILAIPFSVLSIVIAPAGTTAGFWPNLGGQLLAGTGDILAGAVFYPFAAAVAALLYVDLRMRREGLDVELLRSAQHGGPPTVPGGTA
ncbi:MAG: hypothetical protein P8Z68_08440 [Kineosporiaceae bacterium]